ncbi:MAG: CapA family protein [Tissierellia bacterium]|nr:CapA family protein [Tissierellia bacterium]MDD4725173.1 CapA family protein [Tissierellia bacterium]
MKKRIYAILFITTILLLVSCGFNNIQVEDKQDTEVWVNQNTQVVEKQTVKEQITLETQKDRITILAAGDIMFHMPQVNGAKIGDTYDFSNSFKNVKEHIKNSDLALVNFETVVAGNEKGFSGFPRFNSPTETVKALKDAGFDVLSTANNHSMDQGVNGLISTIDTINNNGLENIGTYKDENRSGLIKEVNNIKIGLLSYTYGINGLDSLLPSDKSYMVNLIDEELIQNDIDELNDKVDLTIVFIHWGNEYQKQPSNYQVDLGNKLIEWGADIILGSHSHVIQKAAVVNYEGEDKYIIYSMGNFLSNQRKNNTDNHYTEDGVMVLLNIEKEEKAIIKDIEYIPTWVNRYLVGNSFAHEILPVEEAMNSNNYNDIELRLEKSMEDTITTLNPIN